MIEERALRQLDDVLSRSPLALVALDREFRVTYWSKRAEELFGYTAGQVAGAFPQGSPFACRDEFDKTVPAIVRHSIRNDGELRTFRWTTVDVQDHANYHVIAFAEDITETVAAQAALAESEERFRSLFEANPETVLFFSRDGCIEAVNAAVRRFGPLRHERLVGRHYSAFLDEADVPKHEDYLKRALAGETISHRVRAYGFKRAPIELDVTTVPVERNGRIDGVFSIVRESEARLRSLFLLNPDPVIELDLGGIVRDCNDAAVRVSGLPRRRIVGRSYVHFIPEQTRPSARASFATAAKGLPAFLSLGFVNGKGRWVEGEATIIPQYSQGRIVGIYSIFQDSTERRSAERLAEMQRQRMRDLYYIAASSERPKLRIRASLEMGTRAFELAAGAVVDMTTDSPRLIEAFRTRNARVSADRLIAVARAAAGKGCGTPVVSEQGVAAAIDVAGAPFGALAFVTTEGAPPPFSDTDADLMGLISTLIAGAIETDLSRAQLRTLAYFDTLTGLPNRALLAEKVRDAIEVAQTRLSRAALLYIDLDGFKDVNDTLGHARGDQLLQLVARRLLEAVGERGPVARMGGDEFVVLLPNCDAETARAVVERTIAVLSEPFFAEGTEHFISASVGIAVYPEDGADGQTLVKNADIALSRAKDRGRNGYFFYNPTLEAPIHLRLSQEKLLRRALELAEFEVYYQPQFDLRCNRIVSLEALVRWNHPKSGLILPAQFIPSAEFSGLIVPLGDWVLATAVKQVRSWESTLGPLRLAVNLSARQLHDRDIRKRIVSALDEAGFDFEKLEIEITESVAMTDAAQSASIVRDLAAQGIRVALDDFGTGYSSLAYLRRFDIDVLKIDRSFVAGIGHSHGDETIVKTVIGMAHTLGFEVVAEGVETARQLDFLREHGCDVIQGDVVAPALPAAEFERFVSTNAVNETPAGYGG